MSYHQGKDTRKPTGGRIRPHRKKRRYELGRAPTETLLNERKKGEIRKKERVRGGNYKVRARYVVYANVVDKNTKKIERMEILRVRRNPANADYSRRGVITKGAIIETSIGEAVVTSRPGQDGIINAVLIKKKT